MKDYLIKTFNELKAFAMKGPVIDMAVGIIIGTAFGKIIDSMVKDIIMPPLGWLMGKVDFSNLYLTLPDADGQIHHYASLETAKTAGAITINYGVFLNTVISFVLIVVSVFALIKFINTLKSIAIKKEEEEKPVTTKVCPKCFSEININATKCPCCTADIE